MRFDDRAIDISSYQLLVDSLETDVEWYRASSELLMRAQSWREGAESIVLRGDEITDVQKLIGNRPPGAPELTGLQLDFLVASEEAEQLRLSVVEQRHVRERRTFRGIWAGIAVVIILLAASALWLFTLYNDLDFARLKLDEGLNLKVANTRREVVADAAWLQIVTRHKLALGIIRTGRSSAGPSAAAAGFLINGGALNKRWKDKTVLVTAAHFVRSDNIKPTQEDLRSLQISVIFPAHSNSAAPVKLASLLHWSPYSKADALIFEMDDALHKYAMQADQIQSVKAEYPELGGGVGVLQWNINDGFTLGVSHRLEEDPIKNSRYSLFYANVTGPGSSGSPVFDMDTGKLTCLHQIGSSSSAQPEKAFGGCTSFSKIKASIGQ
ncbi:hypothetical protein AB833_04470 [Chromatiales bacterium (ex Bugula neritina AB1)]|nr:hypothetical protein AB833_04470 [Chromatiales bacterium (ex Bugula neritina AB1)]